MQAYICVATEEGGNQTAPLTVPKLNYEIRL